MPSFGVAIVWIILALVALALDILAILFLQHYRPLYHSIDVALISQLVSMAMTVYFLIPIPAVLELGSLEWGEELCNFYTWMTTTLRFAHFLGLLVMDAYWIASLRTKSRQGHMFMSSMWMKITIAIIWFVSVVVGLAPVTGGTDLFNFYTEKSCNFLPSSISTGFGVLCFVMVLSCTAMGIACSSDSLMLFRSMKQIALTKYNAGRFHLPAVSDVNTEDSGGAIHAKYSELSVATELCRLGLCVTLVSFVVNLLPFAVMQFLLLFSDQYLGTYEDVSLWLQLGEALLLPNLLWMLSGRYRHAMAYAWKVYILRDPSAKEDDASSCTLQSYKIRALEQQQQQQPKVPTVNGVKKTQTNGMIASSGAQHLTHQNRRASNNKITPLESKVNGVGHHISEPADSRAVTNLDDGMTVVSFLRSHASDGNSNGYYKTNGNGQGINGNIEKADLNKKDNLNAPVMKSKPPRKNIPQSPSSGPKVAFADVAENATDVGGSGYIPSTVSSPTKSSASTPQRTMKDVKRTSSVCSRREWKEKMRKKHLPAIFVNNSIDDEKDEKLTYSNGEINEDVHNSIEMKEVSQLGSSAIQKDPDIESDCKQKNYSEDSFYVSSEFHYNYISDSFPRKLSLRKQSTVDSDGASNMYESDDIDNILDTSMTVDQAHQSVATPPDNKIPTPEVAVTSLKKNDSMEESQNSRENTCDIADSSQTEVNDMNRHSANFQQNAFSKEKNELTSLDEFEEIERKVFLNESFHSESKLFSDSRNIEGEYVNNAFSDIRVIDLEANTDGERKDNSVNGNMEGQTKTTDGTAEREGNVDSFVISQNYDQFETVSGQELLQLKQHTVKTVKMANEFVYDSSSDDGGIDNEAFEKESTPGTMNKPINTFTNNNKFLENSYSESSEMREIQIDATLSQDITERFVIGKEDLTDEKEKEEQEGYNTKADRRKSNLITISEAADSLDSLDKHALDSRNLKRNKFGTNPFLRESFEIIAQSQEYQRELMTKDNPFLDSAKPFTLKKQNSFESAYLDEIGPSDSQTEQTNTSNMLSKPPIPARPQSSYTRNQGKSQPAGSNTSTKPPVPIKRPLKLRRQSTKEDETQKIVTEKDSALLARPRTSSEDELERIFDEKGDDFISYNPSFPGEDPSSTICSNTEPHDPVFYSLPEVKGEHNADSVNQTFTFSTDDSVVIEPYGQRRPPWLDEDLDSLSESTSQNIYNTKLHRNSDSTGIPNGYGVEEYDFDSVRIRGVSDVKDATSGSKSNSGSSNFFSSGSDSEITPVSEEEKPTFQFYQFDDDIDKGFEDALSMNYIPHSNLYSGFGLCFESIKEEPEDSLSESASSFDGLGESNNSAIFKTQAIVSRPSSRASVNSSSNVDNSFSASVPNCLSALPLSDQVGSVESAWSPKNEKLSYENFASPNNDSFLTSERTSADGREETLTHSNGRNALAKDTLKKIDSTVVTEKHVVTADGSTIPSPWLEVKNVDLDMSFETDFSQPNVEKIVNSSLTMEDDKHRVKFDDVLIQTPSVDNDHKGHISVKGSETNNFDNYSDSQTKHIAPVYL